MVIQVALASINTALRNAPSGNNYQASSAAQANSNSASTPPAR